MIELIPFDASHLEATYRWMTDPMLREGLLVDRTITPESHRSWFASMQENPTQAVFAAIADGGAHIGNFGYRNLSRRHRSGELWMYVGPEYQGRGYAKQMLQAGLSRGFGPLAIRKIYLHVRPENARAVSIYERAGFVVEGLLKDEQIFAGNPVDMIRMALFDKSGTQ